MARLTVYGARAHNSGPATQPDLLLPWIDFDGGYEFAQFKPQNPVSQVAPRAARGRAIWKSSDRDGGKLALPFSYAREERHFQVVLLFPF
jgi:hypothetical protein